MIYTGFILSIICIIDVWRNQKAGQLFLPTRLFLVFLALVIISFLIPLGMQFTVIDDYVYWGIIGKYLFLNHHLPDPDTTIIAKHLAYTPGTSLFHYFFYTLAGKYKPSLSYFAQNILLISALSVVLKKESLKRTLIHLCLLVILLTLFSGSVFTKLQVDYLLSVYAFAILWIYFREQPTFLTIVAISLPTCFLFLIKEIGFVLGLLVLILVFVDLIFHPDLDRRTRMKSILLIVLTAILLFVLKQIWASHCQVMGFLNFNTAVNMESIWQSFNFFSDSSIQKGALIFMKAILIGPADRLNFPYIFWYLFVIFFWVRIFLKEEKDNKARYARLLKILSVSFVIYLLMMYFLQIIIFKVGDRFDHAVGMTRYLNIFFSQVVFFTALLYVDHRFFQNNISNRVVFSFIMVLILILGLSRVETTLHRDSHSRDAKQVAEKIEKNIQKGKENRIAVVPGTHDHHLGIKLLYHLLPNRLNYGGFPVHDRDIFLSTLLGYDYVFFNNPDARTLELISPLVDKTFENQGFYMIRSKEPVLAGKDKNLGLKKIF